MIQNKNPRCKIKTNGDQDLQREKRDKLDEGCDLKVNKKSIKVLTTQGKQWVNGGFEVVD